MTPPLDRRLGRLPRGSSPKRLALALAVALPCALTVSCEGCPGDPSVFIPTEFGTLNPLFDRARFEDFVGRVVDPSPSVPKRFYVELVLPIDPSSIEASAFLAFAPPPGWVATEEEPYPPEPIEVVRVVRVEPIVEGGSAVAVRATLDRQDIERNLGRDLVVQIDPSAWVFRTTPLDQAFTLPMRFSYEIATTSPDGNPPYLADLTGAASSPLSNAIGRDPVRADETIVVPHARLSFTFSEPMSAATPLLDPEDTVGFRPVATARVDGGFTELVSAPTAGLAPGTRYCISYAPPLLLDSGPLSWGAQDLSGEPLVPFASTASTRRSLARLGDATDVCFTTGDVRIESPRPNALVAGADGSMPLEFITSRCVPSPTVDCDTVFYRVMARARGSDDELGGDWQTLGDIDPESAGFTLTTGKLLSQGEIRAPIDLGSYPLFPIDDPLPPGAGGGGETTLGELCVVSRGVCPIDLRVDQCSGGSAGCVLGDIVTFEIDKGPVLAPTLPSAVCPAGPAPASDCVRLVDVDDRDCRIDSICVSGGGEDLDRVRVVLCGVTLEVELQETARPASLGGGTWLCSGPVDADVEGSAGSDTVTLTPIDRGGLIGDAVALTAACFEPLRRVPGGLAFGDLIHFRDADGFPVVIHDEASGEGSRLVLSRFEGTEWTSQVLLTLPRENYFRGRMDDELLPDGSRLFCATSRGIGAVGTDINPSANSGIRDLFAGNGSIFLGRIDPSGSVTVRNVGSAHGLGCALALSPGFGSVAIAYATGGTGLPRDRRATSAAPTLRICNAATATCELTSVIRFANVDGARPLGMEPDILWTPARILIVGRGLQPAGSGAGFEEHTIYLLGTSPDVGGHRVSLTVVERDDSRVESPLSLAGPIERFRGGLEPRILGAPFSGAHTIVYYRYSWERRCPAFGTCNAAPVSSSLDIVGLLSGTSVAGPTVLEALGTMRAPPQRIFRVLPDLALPLLRSDDPDMLEPEVMPGWDVVPSAGGFFLHLAYTRRYVGGHFGPRAESFGNAPVGTASSIWRETVQWTGTALRSIVGSLHRIDVETGYDRNSTMHLSLAVDPASGADDPPSVAYDVTDTLPAFRQELRVADLRAGQWIDTPEGRARAPRVPPGTCWDRRNEVPVLSARELVLTPDLPIPELSRPWASRRADTLRFAPNATPLNDYRDITGNLSCILAFTAGLDGTSPELPEFYRTARDPLAGRFTSLAASLIGHNPAVVHSRRFDPDALLSFAGNLSFEANGRFYRSGDATAGTRLGDLSRALNAGFTTATHPWVSVHQAGDFARLVVTMEEDECRPGATEQRDPSECPQPDGRHGCPPPLVCARTCDADGLIGGVGCVPLGAVEPTPPPPASLRVLDGGLAESLGLPHGDGAPASRGAWVDPSHGDEADVFGACPFVEPCVPESSPGADDGTCGRVAECFEPGAPLLASYIHGARLGLGSPPTRVLQTGLCVPIASPSSSTPYDRCDDTSAAGLGTNRSYASHVIPADGACPAGSEPINETVCTSCGLLPDPGNPLVPAAGYVRLCNRHEDCSVDIRCTDVSDCNFGPGDFYCTHRGSPYLDVPAGMGFCARALRPSACAGRPTVTIVPPHMGSRPEASFLACASVDPRPGRAAEDFEPAALECVAAGCAMAVGPRINTYCLTDAECPANHECSVDVDLRTPAGLLRPLFGDPRFADALGDAPDVVPSTASTVITNLLTDVEASLRPSLASAVRTIGGVIPRRIFGVRESGPPDFRIVHDRLYYAVEALRADLDGIEIRPFPDTADRPGAGDLEVRIGLTGRLEVHARLEGDITLGGVSHGLDTFIGVDTAAEGVRIRLRPQTRFDPDGTAHLGFRLVQVELLRLMDPDEPLQRSDLRIVFSTQQGELVAQWLEVFFSIFVDTFVTGLFEAIRLGELEAFVDLTPDEVLVVGSIGDAYVPLFLSPAGPFLLGEETSFDPAASLPVLDGVAIEMGVEVGVEGSRPAPRDVSALGLHVRGEPWLPATGSLGDELNRDFIIPRITSPNSDFCGLLLLPDPNCLETPRAEDCRAP